MGKPKKTEEEKARNRAAGAAKRFNNEQAARAPLLAYAGLTPTRTADDVLERKAQFFESTFWSGLEKSVREAQDHARMAWHRYVVWSVVDAETYARVVAWADRQTLQTYLEADGPVQRLGDQGMVYWSYMWKQAAACVQRGESPLPSSAVIQPSACYPDLKRALNDGREARCYERSDEYKAVGNSDAWRVAIEAHTICSPDFCRVSLRPRRVGRVIGS
jgi:hypothetical protein